MPVWNEKAKTSVLAANSLNFSCTEISAYLSHTYTHIHSHNTHILSTQLEIHLQKDGADEETQFMQKLEYLRSQAEVFLRMLNEMRRRLKELPPEAQAAKQYRYIMLHVFLNSAVNTRGNKQMS